ncbi:serine/threonine-protein kinase [Streptomyces sp. NBC_01443]|uniref:serine/threonine-protein kinase n=1 Tax=Streptomyces sp. NBC_01443 TaxID=2903868 RepID=UPI002257D759|nr:serine/threonine-protein kinase [Streptomyces sp. NBC_01443]MCX4626586.1 serine/threonine protein kinase [Streptomyces sp. NBC_01443]
MSHDGPDSSIVIAGRYRLEKRLGRGGMGTVWRASDELLGRPVAVKELHVDGGADAKAALREARTVAQVRHPHVVVVHDVVEHDGRPHIVMELVDGGSLAERLGAEGPLTPAETARTGLAMLGALTAAHARGVLHRDVKPANVLMEAGTGRVVLTDFGIARLAGSTTISETGAFVGSPEYTSPERMQGAVAGPESDLWSLGVLLCAALTGESPFHRDSLGGVLHAVVYDEIRPPAQAGPLVPVIRGLLERLPERRMGAAEAERLLSAYVSTGKVPVVADRVPPPSPVSAPPTGTASGADAAGGYSPTEHVPQPSAPARRARPALRAGLIAALFAVAVAGAVAVTSQLGDRSADGARETTPTATASGWSRASADAKPAQTFSPTPAPARTAPPSVAGPAKPAPAGYRSVSDPAGFSLAVPDGFQRSTDDERVFYVSPDGVFRIGVKVKPAVSDGPVAVMRLSHANGPATNPGYRDGTVVPTTHNGLPAALWEFTWNGFTAAEGARHTFDVCWDENGRMYDVWVSAPVGRLAEARSHFDAALDSFVPGGPAAANG